MRLHTASPCGSPRAIISSMWRAACRSASSPCCRASSAAECQTSICDSSSPHWAEFPHARELGGRFIGYWLIPGLTVCLVCVYALLGVGILGKGPSDASHHAHVRNNLWFVHV